MADAGKQAAISAIDKSRDELRRCNTELWKKPELKFEEFHAHKVLTDFLESEGFTVERGYCEIETAFRAT